MMGKMMRVCVLATVAIVGSACAEGAEDKSPGWILPGSANGSSRGVGAPAGSDELVDPNAELAVVEAEYRGALGPNAFVDVASAGITFSNGVGETVITLDDGLAAPESMVIVRFPFDLVDPNAFGTGEEYITSCSGLLPGGTPWEDTSPPLDISLTQEGGNEFMVEFTADYADGSTVDGALFFELR